MLTNRALYLIKGKIEWQIGKEKTPTQKTYTNQKETMRDSIISADQVKPTYSKVKVIITHTMVGGGVDNYILNDGVDFIGWSSDAVIKEQSMDRIYNFGKEDKFYFDGVKGLVKQDDWKDNIIFFKIYEPDNNVNNKSFKYKVSIDLDGFGSGGNYDIAIVEFDNADFGFGRDFDPYTHITDDNFIFS